MATFYSFIFLDSFTSAYQNIQPGVQSKNYWL